MKEDLGNHGVLKFLKQSPPTVSKRAKLEEELSWWNRCYPELGAHCRVIAAAGHPALLIPRLAPVERSEAVLDEVRAVLKQQFVAHRLIHRDVRWRNIGKYARGGQVHYVIFDLETVEESEEDAAWVDTAIHSLKETL